MAKLVTTCQVISLLMRVRRCRAIDRAASVTAGMDCVAALAAFMQLPSYPGSASMARAMFLVSLVSHQ